MTRAILIVLDSVGCGGAEDAKTYGDEGADTLGHDAGKVIDDISRGDFAAALHDAGQFGKDGFQATKDFAAAEKEGAEALVAVASGIGTVLGGLNELLAGRPPFSGNSTNFSAALRTLPITRSTMAPISSGVPRNAPKPGMALGSVKSHAFSASPTKSRIVGSADQARRSAARLSSAGIPLRKNSVMSVAAVIESTEGNFDRSISGSEAASAVSGDAAAVCPGGDGACSAALDSCLRRDQRLRNSSSLIRARLPCDGAPAPPDWRGRACA